MHREFCQNTPLVHLDFDCTPPHPLFSLCFLLERVRKAKQIVIFIFCADKKRCQWRWSGGGGTGDLCDCEIVAVAHAGALIDPWFSCMEIYDSGPSYLIVSTRQTQKWKPNCPLCMCVPLGLFVCVCLKLADRSIVPPTELVVFAQILNELHLLTTIMTLYLHLFANCGTATIKRQSDLTSGFINFNLTAFYYWRLESTSILQFLLNLHVTLFWQQLKLLVLILNLIVTKFVFTAWGKCSIIICPPQIVCCLQTAFN